MVSQKGCAGSEMDAIVSCVMLPSYANFYGKVHGAVILGLIDEAAYAAATRLTRKDVVLAAVNNASFEHPVMIGSLLTLHPRIARIGRTSVRLKILVRAEDLKKRKTIQVGSADVVMVAVDHKGHPVTFK
jgi:acyl-CoA hydrolase